MTHRNSLSRLQSHGFDREATQWIKNWLNGCTKRLKSFQCPAEEQSWVAFLQRECCDHHWLTEGTFYMKILACGIPRDTPKLCLPMWRGILCRVCSSDSSLQDCPCVLMTPCPLDAWGWAASPISLSASTGPTYPFRAILCHQGELLETVCCLIQVCFENLHTGKTPVKSGFPCVWVDTSLLKQITVTKGQPVDSRGSMYLLT